MRPYTPFDKILDLKDEEIRKTKHALWLARALRAKSEAGQHLWFRAVAYSQGNKEAEMWHDSLYRKWNLAERKCRQKAKEYE